MLIATFEYVRKRSVERSVLKYETSATAMHQSNGEGMSTQCD